MSAFFIAGAGLARSVRPSDYEWLSVTADFRATGYGFYGSLLIFDSKEPAEFRLSQLTTLSALYDTNTTAKQINELFDGME